MFFFPPLWHGLIFRLPLCFPSPFYFILRYFRVIWKQRTSLRLIIKGARSRLGISPAACQRRPQHPRPARHVYGWDVASAAHRKDGSQPQPTESKKKKKIPGHLRRWHFPHRPASASIWCSPFGSGRIWSCPNVTPPCGFACRSWCEPHDMCRLQSACLVGLSFVCVRVPRLLPAALMLLRLKTVCLLFLGDAWNEIK